MNWKIWILVPIAYLAFALWYFNWSGPLSPEEVESFLAVIDQQEAGNYTDRDVFRQFLEEDDGKEFVMVNLVQFHQGGIEHPVTSELTTGRELVESYFQPFALALFKRGGHPVFQARTVGGPIDTWNADENKPFAATAMMRYRSRRDMLELVVAPAFADGHIYKLAAIERTISYPTQYVLTTSLRPPAAGLIVLLLLASVAQNLVFWRQR
jgi:succinate dehydrogenase flavin-adding protein (antitoxin of CptAB toxin-antitoxin module)